MRAKSVHKILQKPVLKTGVHSTTYAEDDFNDGMLRAATLDASVGGCSSATRKATASSPDDRYSHHSPSDEWFRHILSMTDENSALEAFGQAARTALDALYQLGRLPEVLDVAIYMHQIPCHSKKLGSDLRDGKSKGGTNRFETYITAQCVNPKSRIILAALDMDKSSSVHESVRETINLCLENVSAVGSRLGLILIDRGFFSANSVSRD